MLAQAIRNMRSLFFGKPKKLALTIPTAYFFVILLTVAFSFWVLYQISAKSAQKEINEASLQTMSSIQTNVDLMVSNLNNYSKMIFSDSNLQNLLREGSVYSDLQTQAAVSHYLYNLMQAVPIIESVHIFDNSGHRFSVGTQQAPTFAKANVKEAPWYEQVVADQGKFTLKLNGSGAFADDAEGNFVSFIRLIRDLDDTSPLGILVINISADAFVQAYSDLSDEDVLQVAILDENNEIISAMEDNSVELLKQELKDDNGTMGAAFRQSDAGFLEMSMNAQLYTVSYRLGGTVDWKFVGITPNKTIYANNKSLVLLALLLLVINGTVFFASSFIISRSIISPIHRLLRSMTKAQDGKFQEVSVTSTSYEFEQLYNGYNDMIAQIHRLLKRIVEEQNTIRQAELSALQAQIKPHFLYNTLDSITSLALSGNNDRVCELIEALGSYYRMSVSKGRDVITVGEEIEMVRNYMKIQKARYENVFEVLFDVDEECRAYPILKLVLQPLVENALYHGIRPKGTKGWLKINARKVEGSVILSVSDDGVGMSEEAIKEVLQSEITDSPKSFGLWGTMQRLRIFYKNEDCVRLDSEPGRGTTITLVIPEEVET
ncbi:sensor histidine kinase [Paenibacillus sp. TRM 82003]|nr:sensor histidine kinase [Paenibacillus sp. TRM 82003]